MIDRRVSHKTTRTLAAAFLLALMTVIAAHWTLNSQLMELQKKESIFQGQITAKALILQEATLSRKNDEEALHFQEKVASYQDHTQAFLQRLANHAAKPVCFTHLSRFKNKMEWQGYALSSRQLLTYLKNLMNTKQFSEMTVESLQQEVMQEKVRFKIRAEETDALSVADNEGKPS